MVKSETDVLQKTAQELRKTIVTMAHTAGSGHCGGSLSCAEILTVLYDEIMNVDPADPNKPDRDRLVLSKGHAAPALYATLHRKGFFTDDLMTLRRLGSNLQGHPAMHKLPGIDMSSGSLGLGLSAGLGMALAARHTGHAYRVFVICGDGELQEGQNWEAMMAAAKFKPGNLTMILDRNRVQLDGTEDEVMPMGDVNAKIAAFGWDLIECDGHDPEELLNAFKKAEEQAGPAAIIANTVKGKGVSYMEGQSVWHGKPVGDEDYDTAMKDLAVK